MPTGDGKVFLIKRFDRRGNQRIHIEDFGQILDRPPGNYQYAGHYEELAEVLKWISPESIPEFFKVLIFNVVSGNGDAHLKNFSLIYDLESGRSAELSPAYDLVPTVLYYADKKEKLALELGGSKSFYDVSKDSFGKFFEIANSVDIDGRTIVQESLESILEAFEQPDVQQNFSTAEVEKIRAHIASIPIVN
jgi:serine/threonine-protein kinase HipA